MVKVLANSGLVLALVGAVITVLAAFGVGISDAQNVAITGLVSAILGVVSAYFSTSIQAFGKTV